MPKVLVGGSVRREAWDEKTIHAFSDTFMEPDRARAAVQMYRVFNLREAPKIARGRYENAHLTVPTKLLFGTGDAALNHNLLAGYEHHADEMTSRKSTAAATSSPTSCPTWSPKEPRSSSPPENALLSAMRRESVFTT